MRNRALVIIAALLILGSAFVRFSGLKKRGIFQYDEGYYLMYGQFVSSALRNVVPIAREVKSGVPVKMVYDKYIEGTFLSTPKPLAPAAVALAGIFTGGVKDYTANYLSAFFGFFTVILLGYILWKYYRSETALIGMAILGFMEYHIIDSRSSFPETVPTFLLLSAVYLLWLWARKESDKTKLWMAAVVLALAFGYNYRYIVAIGLVWAAALFAVAIADKKFNFFVSVLITTCIGLAVLVFLLELPYFFVKAAGDLPAATTDASGNAIMIMTYWDMLFKWLGGKAGSAVANVAGLSTYHLKSLWAFVGPAVLTLYVIGIYSFITRLAKRKMYETEFLVLLLSLVPIVLFSVQSLSGRPRALSFSLPFIAWIAAVGAEKVLSGLGKVHKGAKTIFLFTTFVVVLSANGIARSMDTIRLKSKYAEACQFLINKGGDGKHFTTNWAVTAYYTGRANSLSPLPATADELEKAYESGIRYIFIDKYMRDKGEYLNGALNDIETTAVFDNSAALHLSNMSRNRDYNLMRAKTDNTVQKIFIYEIEDILRRINRGKI